MSTFLKKLFSLKSNKKELTGEEKIQNTKSYLKKNGDKIRLGPYITHVLMRQYSGFSHIEQEANFIRPQMKILTRLSNLGLINLKLVKTSKKIHPYYIKVRLTKTGKELAQKFFINKNKMHKQLKFKDMLHIPASIFMIMDITGVFLAIILGLATINPVDILYLIGILLVGAVGIGIAEGYYWYLIRPNQLTVKQLLANLHDKHLLDLLAKYYVKDQEEYNYNSNDDMHLFNHNLLMF